MLSGKPEWFDELVNKVIENKGKFPSNDKYSLLIEEDFDMALLITNKAKVEIISYGGYEFFKGVYDRTDNQADTFVQPAEISKSGEMEDYMKEENKITSKFGNDPVAMLRARELDLQAQENTRKRKEGEERLNLDRMRAMLNKDTQEEKLEQNERLANLRSDTSIEKTILQNELKKE